MCHRMLGELKLDKFDAANAIVMLLVAQNHSKLLLKTSSQSVSDQRITVIMIILMMVKSSKAFTQTESFGCFCSRPWEASGVRWGRWESLG